MYQPVLRGHGNGPHIGCAWSGVLGVLLGFRLVNMN